MHSLSGTRIKARTLSEYIEKQTALFRQTERLRVENEQLQEEVRQLRKEVEMWKTLAMPDSDSQ